MPAPCIRSRISRTGKAAESCSLPPSTMIPLCGGSFPKSSAAGMLRLCAVVSMTSISSSDGSIPEAITRRGRRSSMADRSSLTESSQDTGSSSTETVYPLISLPSKGRILSIDTLRSYSPKGEKPVSSTTCLCVSAVIYAADTVSAKRIHVSLFMLFFIILHASCIWYPQHMLYWCKQHARSRRGPWNRRQSSSVRTAALLSM